MNAAISTGAEALVSSVTKATLSMEQDKAMLDRDCKTMAGQLKDTIQKTSQYGLGASALNKIHFEHLQSRLQLHKETVNFHRQMCLCLIV